MSRARPFARQDAVAGLLATILGIAVLWHVRGFPELEDGSPGPALFPGIVAALLVLFGVALVVRSAVRRTPEVSPDAGPAASTDTSEVQADGQEQRVDEPGADTEEVAADATYAGDTTRPEEDADEADAAATDAAVTVGTSERIRPRALLNAGAVLLAVVAYIVLSGTLGFVLTLAPLLAILMALLSARIVVAVAAAVVTTAAVTVIFQLVLRVPLPIGPLGF